MIIQAFIFTDTLCTVGIKAICNLSIVCAGGYFVWAIISKPGFQYPPNWTHLKHDNYSSKENNAFLIAIILTYETVQVAVAAFCVICCCAFTFYDFQEIFEWTC
jgi:hypothetical protein